MKQYGTTIFFHGLVPDPKTQPIESEDWSKMMESLIMSKSHGATLRCSEQSSPNQTMAVVFTRYMEVGDA